MSKTKAKQWCAAQGDPGDQLRELVTGLDPARAIAALLTLGWSAALRRSELVGLDWRKQSDGRGIVEIVDKGIRAVLATSKGSQEGAVEIPVPCDQMRPACDAHHARS
jgi:site-specific recombinase XerC